MFSFQPFWLNVFKQAARGGRDSFLDSLTAKKLELAVTVQSAGIIREGSAADKCQCGGVMAARVLYVCVDVSDRAMWDEARWESTVDKGAGVY